MEKEPDQRLDVILVSEIQHVDWDIWIQSSALAFTSKSVHIKKGVNHNLSDHFGVISSVVLYKKQQ